MPPSQNRDQILTPSFLYDEIQGSSYSGNKILNCSYLGGRYPVEIGKKRKHSQRDSMRSTRGLLLAANDKLHRLYVIVRLAHGKDSILWFLSVLSG